MPKTVSEKVRRPPNPTGKGGFGDNPRPGPGRGKKKAVQQAGAQIAAEMEYAYANAELPTDTPGIKAARLLAHSDYPKFLGMYLKAKELAGESEAVQKQEVATAAIGEKEASLEELANRLLEEWGEVDGEARSEEAAELAD